ncbi:MAG TPA: DUF3016 domain-containing protein [Ramlibacter sp.]|nr:DUF3016 domain-containing protein [Ramlibacter sp.]
MTPSRILLAAATLVSSAAFAGSADVKFIDTDNMTDLATNRFEEADTMRAVTNHLQRLAQRLPADQVLHVDFLDVDLAGTWKETRRGRIRTVKNLADPPKFHVRYTLESRGNVLRTGEDRITDIDYTNHVFLNRTSTPLYFEKRVLDEWFAHTFAPQVASAR